jgi:spermidine/putrescine transport system ATP-binding protein
MIAGFERPDSGAIRLHGVDITSAPPERRDVNVVFQSFALFPHLSAYDNVAFGLRMKKLPRAAVSARVGAALALVHLEHEARRLPRQLSGGQQQRVALARALINEPAVLVLDEPLSALDQSLRGRMQSELRRIQRDSGVTFVHITHDQNEALSLADRIGVMRAGRFEQVATPREIYATPANAFVAAFVGPNNVLAASIRDDRSVELDGGEILPVPTMLPPGTTVLLAVRPYGFRISRAGGEIRGRVIRVAFNGHGIDVEVALDERRTLAISALATDAAVAVEGEMVGIELDPAAVIVLGAG